jgi:hypothetical protein
MRLARAFGPYANVTLPMSTKRKHLGARTSHGGPPPAAEGVPTHPQSMLPHFLMELEEVIYAEAPGTPRRSACAFTTI